MIKGITKPNQTTCRYDGFITFPCLHQLSTRAIGGSETEAGKGLVNHLAWWKHFELVWICIPYQLLQDLSIKKDVGHWWMRSLGSRGRTCPALRMPVVFNNWGLVAVKLLCAGRSFWAQTGKRWSETFHEFKNIPQTTKKIKVKAQS